MRTRSYPGPRFALAKRLQKRTVHNVNIDISFFRMAKRARQSAGDLETKLVPKVDRGGVRRDNEIELHGTKSKSPRLVQRVLAHLASHSKPTRIWRNHEGSVRDMRTGAGL